MKNGSTSLLLCHALSVVIILQDLINVKRPSWSNNNNKIDLVNARSCEFVSNDGKRFRGKSNADITQFSLPKGQFYGYLKCKIAAWWWAIKN